MITLLLDVRRKLTEVVSLKLPTIEMLGERKKEPHIERNLLPVEAAFLDLEHDINKMIYQADPEVK